jgi:hypothetical protein
MPQRIQLPDGTLAEFPDGMPDSEIESVLSREFAPNPGTDAPESGMLDGLMNVFNTGRALDTGIRVGSAKAAGRTVVGLGEMIRKALGMSPQPLGSTAQALGLEPSGGAEGAGALVTDALSFLAPGAGTAKLPLAGRMAAEGGLSALIGQAQGADPVTSGLLGAAAPGVGAVVERAAPRLAAGAQRGMSQFLGAAKETNKAKSEKVIPRLLDEGISGSRESVLARASTERQAAGRAVGATRTAEGAEPVVTHRAADSLEPLKKKLLVKQANGTMGAATPAAQKQIELIEALQQTIRDTSPEVKSVAALREVLGDEIGTGFSKLLPTEERSALRVKKAAYKALREELHKASPNLAKVDAEFSFWKDVEDILTATTKRTKPQEGSVVTKAVNRISEFAGVGGIAAGAPPVAGTALAMGVVNRIVSSPSYKAWSAVKKDRLARALANGDERALLNLVRGFIAAPTQTRQSE